jgi:hypothetical protein
MLSSLVLCAVLGQLNLKLEPKPEPVKGAIREFTVEAGKFDRQNTVVWVDYVAPAGARLAVRDQQGRTSPLQVSPDGKAAFAIDLQAGAKGVYRVVDDPYQSGVARVTIDSKDPAVISVLADGRPVIQYEGRATTGPRTDVPANLIRAGFIHPVFSPGGAVVTEAYPESQPRDLGIWSFWPELRVGKQTVDLWNKPGEGGRVSMESKGPTWAGPIHGGFESRQLFSGPKAQGGQTLLHESWRVTVYAPRSSGQSYFLFDLDSEQTTVSDVPVEVSKAPYGGIAFRGRGEWMKEPAKLRRLTSEKTPQPARARWAFLGGPMLGKTAGLAVLSHPSNAGAPQALAPSDKEPIINFVPNSARPLKIEPGTPFKSRYRFVALDGQPDARVLERLWNDFAFPPIVKARVIDQPRAKKTAQQP